ncbi:MAG TPA: ABC transporter ATP-binding protein [Rhodopila sp.]|jgi:putative ABC transport system ATP-binding protein
MTRSVIETPVIEAIDITKNLGQGAGQVRALDGVSLALTGGQLTLLMGPSGSGKTTLLSILGCMLTPTEGEVRILGRSVAGAKPGQLAELRRDHVGFIFQNYHLLPTLSAVDNVRLALDVRGEPAAAALAKAKDALAGVGLAHRMNAFPRQLSGGEQQRVAIARAIVGDASAILADEPTGALDSENGHAIMMLLSRIARDSRRGVLVVTHDPRALPFADRIIHMEDGRILNEEYKTPVAGRREWFDNVTAFQRPKVPAA